MADGAYDTYAFYKIIDEKWQAEALIPPAKTSKSQDELKNPPQQPFSYLKQRDTMIKNQMSAMGNAQYYP